MARKILILLLVLFPFTAVFPESDNPADYSSQILSLEKKFRTIDQSFEYLKKNNAELGDLSKIREDALNLFKEIKDNPDSLKDYDMALQLLDARVSILEEKSAEKISFVRRSAFMYIIMAIAGTGIILFMVIYLILMYLRRK